MVFLGPDFRQGRLLNIKRNGAQMGAIPPVMGIARADRAVR
jgi:hypothetical protein